jgi:hypothetical protein
MIRMKMNRFATRLAAIGAVLALGIGSAKADSVTAYLNTTGTDSVTASWCNGGTSGSYTYDTYADNYLGTIGWTSGTVTTDTLSNHLPAGVVPSFTTFCIEGSQNVTIGANNSFSKVWDGSNMVGNVPNPTLGDAFSSTTVTLLTELYDEHYSSSLTAAQADAFQLAVWKIAYDNGGQIGDTSSGNTVRFFVAAANLSNSDVTTANSWLSTLSTATHTGNYEVIALTSSSLQDQITAVPIPVPASAWMGLTTLAGIALAAGFRRKMA